MDSEKQYHKIAEQTRVGNMIKQVLIFLGLTLAFGVVQWVLEDVLCRFIWS